MAQMINKSKSRLRAKGRSMAFANTGQFVVRSAGTRTAGAFIAMRKRSKMLKPIKAKFNPTDQELEAITEGAEELLLSMSDEEKFEIC